MMMVDTFSLLGLTNKEVNETLKYVHPIWGCGKSIPQSHNSLPAMDGHDHPHFKELHWC
jgi:hypothetical protein